ncbi:hypothetical protein DSECCO2_79240 [anaerobic digester metagenome]
MVKPYKIVITLIILLLLLALPGWFLRLSEVTILGKTIVIPNVNKLFTPDTLSYTPTSSLLNPELENLDKHIDTAINSISYKTGGADYISIADSLLMAINSVSQSDSTAAMADSTTRITADWLRNRIIPIEFADSSAKELNPFFEALRKNLPSKELIRVMHYGDSQIEGDRVTSFLRARLQSRFGGGGVGLLHAVPFSYQFANVTLSTSSNWEKLILADGSSKSSGVKRLGTLFGFSSFKKSKSLFGGEQITKAWVEMQRMGSRNVPARNFTQLRVFYGYNNQPFTLELMVGEQTLDAELIPTTASLSKLQWDVPLSVNTMKLRFSGTNSPMIYALALDAKKGIAVDNIALRGSSGTDFTRTDLTFFKEMMGMLNTKLIILQFGVNVVPHVVSDYTYYEEQLYNQIAALKRIAPSASVVVIGVSDMARKEGGEFVSYPNIEHIRNAQRNAAFRAGAAFWDCYTAMGGKNAMVAWAFANPALANKDFVHFTYRGSRLVAEMFYAALMSSYQQHLRKFDKPAEPAITEDK